MSNFLGFGLLSLSFAVFWLSLLGWGSLFSRKNSIGQSLVIGTAIAMATPQFLSFFGLLNQAYMPFGFVGLGLILVFVRGPRPSAPNIKNSPETWIPLGILGLLFICRFFEASLLQPHGDALYYNLLSAAKWHQLGRIEFIPELPLLYQSSWWDYLYLWPAMIFQSAPNVGLMESQIFSQWIHLFVGLLGSVLLWDYILKTLKFETLSRHVSTLAIVACASLWWTAALAKNDWGSILLFLGALSFYLESRLVVAGLLFGMAIATKWTSLFIAAPFLVWLIYKNLKSPKTLLLFCGSILLGLLPIAIRNVWATGNPIFPIPLGDLGSIYVSNTFSNYMQQYTQSGWTQNWLQLLQVRAVIFKESPFAWLGFFSFLFLWKTRNRVLPFYSMTLIGFILFSLKSGLTTENRLFGVGIVMLVGFGAVLATELIPNRKWKWLLFAVAMATSRLPLHMPKKFFEEWPPTLSRINAGDIKEQIQKQIPPGSSILTTGDNEHYYLSAYQITDLPNHPSLDVIVATQPTVLDGLLKVKESGYRYVLQVTRFDGYCWPGFCEKLQAGLGEFQNLVILRGQNAVLLDLDRLNPR